MPKDPQFFFKRESIGTIENAKAKNKNERES